MHAEFFNIYNKTSEKYLNILQNWYKERDWQPLPASHTGAMIFEGNNPICAGWLYKTDSSICLIANIISNQNRNRKKKEAIKFLLDSLEQQGKKQGYSILLLFMTVSSITNIAKQNGYVYTAKADELVKYLA